MPDEPSFLPPHESFKDIQQTFESLGIQSFDADLPNGRIRWFDEAGVEVATGTCKAICSYASANMSLLWAQGLEHFVAAGVPMVERQEHLPMLMEKVPAKNAELFAMRAAERDGAQFYYAAPSGEGSSLYLAIHDFQPVMLSGTPAEA